MSPMSPRLLRPRAGGGATDPDARTFINAVQTADGATLEPAVVKAIDDFVIGCKADGIWTALKASCILMGARTLSGALTPLVGTAPTNVNFVSGDYNRKTGLLGDGASKYLNSNRVGSADGQNDKHHAVYASTAATLNNNCFIGFFDTPRCDLLHISGQGFASFMNASDQHTVSSSATPGFVGSSRASSSQFTTRSLGTTATRNSTSSAPAATQSWVFARGGSATPIHGAHRIAFYSIGSALTLATLDSRVSALYTAIGAAIT